MTRIVNQDAIPPTQPGITRQFALAAPQRAAHDLTLVASGFDHLTRPAEPEDMFRSKMMQGVRSP